MSLYELFFWSDLKNMILLFKELKTHNIKQKAKQINKNREHHGERIKST